MDGITTSKTFGGFLSGKTDLLSRIQDATLRQMASATVGTAADVIISGAKFDEALKSHVLAAAAGVIGEIAANDIGEAYAKAKVDGIDPLEYGLHKALHAALGCGTAAMTGASCGAGAIGGAAGAAVAEAFYDPTDKAVELAAKVRAGELTDKQMFAQMLELQSEGVDMARLSAALAVFVTGAKSGGDVYAGADAGQNAAQNNVLETAWDLASLALSLAELGEAIPSGDTKAILIAAAAAAFDTGAVVIPFLPGGAGAALKLSREGGRLTAKVVPQALPAAIKPQVIDAKLSNLVDNVYKGAANPNRVGDGSLGDAVRYELATGSNVHG